MVIYLWDLNYSTRVAFLRCFSSIVFFYVTRGFEKNGIIKVGGWPRVRGRQLA